MIVIMSLCFTDHLSRLRYVTRSVSKDTMLFERNDPVVSVFRIISGEVHLLRRQFDGAECILQRAKQGDLLAEASITTDGYHCGAVAVKPTVLAVFSRKDVRRMVSDDPDAVVAFVAHLADEVRKARLRAEIMSLKRVCDRLDAWLTWHDGGVPEKGSWHRFASEIGVSPEALYRELARRR